MKTFISLFLKALAILVPFVGVLVLWCVHIYLLKEQPDFVKNYLPTALINTSTGTLEYGTIGDSFGSLNTLYSGLALAAIIVTLWLQAADLRATKQEMRNQTVQFAEQNAQTEIKNIKEEVHARINWIKQLEKDIQTRWRN